MNVFGERNKRDSRFQVLFATSNDESELIFELEFDDRRPLKFCLQLLGQGLTSSSSVWIRVCLVVI